MDRRNFLVAGAATAMATSAMADNKKKSTSKSTAASTTAAIVPSSTTVKSRVIVIGGGMAGSTVAKYLRLWGDSVEVTLVERMPTYTSNIMSSLVLTGQRTLSSLTYKYDALRSKYGVTTIFGEVVSVDPVNAKVTLADKTVLTADRIVMAPGITFDTVPGLGASNKMPHAWTAGPQTTLLASQLGAMRAGGVAILTIPKTPYRCPPGPYERACLIADWLRVKKPGSKLIVLDANPDIVTEKDNFTSAFLGLHGNVIEYHNNAEVLSVDPLGMNLYTNGGGSFHGDVVNMIPRQRAGGLIEATGLNNATEGRFAGVNVLSYASTTPGASKVHIIGDSSATTQPKAGHIANQEAKVCADALSRILAGGSPDAAPVTNSACFSTITTTQASWLHAMYQYDPVSGTMQAVPAATGASVGWNAESFKDMGKWFGSLMADTFA
jgi:NADH dehydrogenase FAD-containing subunit